MRRLLLLLNLFVLIAPLSAQINNPSFESWTQVFTFENPDGWTTGNQLLSLAGTFTTLKDTSASDGNLAALLQTKFVSLAGANVPGVLTTGVIDFNFATGEVGFISGTPFPYRPDKLTFDFKYIPAGAATLDTAGVFIVLTAWDATNLLRDTIGVGGVFITDTTTTYTTQDMPINYLSAGTPDSMLLVFSSSATLTSPQDGSRFWVDNVQVAFPVGKQPLATVRAINVFPNPATGYISISNPGQSVLQLRLFDVMGREVRSRSIQPGLTTLLVQQLDRGMYFYQLTDAAGNMVKTGKISLVH